MPLPHLLELDDDALLVILRKVTSADPPCLTDVLLVCKRFRNVLLSVATSVYVTCNNAALLRHGRGLRAMTLACCSRLPWAMDTGDGAPCCAPVHLRHLSALTRLDASAALVWDAEMRKLQCLPSLQHLHVSDSMPDSGLQQLSAVTSLRQLSLSGCTRLTASGLKHLAQLTFLESLDFH